jgi:CBS domain-containing protein
MQRSAPRGLRESVQILRQELLSSSQNPWSAIATVALNNFRKGKGNMKVKDVMTKEVKTCSLETDLAEAADSMWMRDCGMLPVVDGKGQVVGIITDRDICIATGCRRRDPATILVREVMAGQAYSCSPEADLREALQIMQQKQVRRLPVIDCTGKLCGVLSLSDVALKVQPDAKAHEPGAREIHVTLKSICAHRGKPEEATPHAATAPVQRKETASA